MNQRTRAEWDDAYANRPYIPGGDAYPARWVEDAARFRDALAASGRLEGDHAYGPDERNRMDIFHPEGPSRGLMVFVHGGYWMSFQKSDWSHLAAGALSHGFTVAMPSYVLCPVARISSITAQIGAAIEHAASHVEGPLHLSGHSAGGHLVSRMVSSTSPLSAETRRRVRKVVSISGVHDLRPLLNTSLNDTLRIDEQEATIESPVLLEPLAGTDITFWVGGAERPEFLRQTREIAAAWQRAGVTVSSEVEDARHHFDVIEGLSDPRHALARTLLAL